MANVFIPNSIRDKATRDTFNSIVAALDQTGTGSVEVQVDDPTNDTPGTTGDIIYATGSESIWVFQGTTWDRGSSGAQGLFDVNIFIRSATQPVTPTTGSYTYSTNTVVPPTGWATDIGDLTGDDQVWFTSFTYDPQTDPDVVDPVVWNQPTQSGSPGVDGDPGITLYISSDRGIIFKNRAGDPITLTANVNIGGEEPTDTVYDTYEYDWTYDDMTVCVTDAATRTVISTNGVPNVVDVNGINGVCALGLPADSTNLQAIGGNLNTGVLRSIVVGPEDVTTQTRFKVSVDIGE